MHQDPYYLPRKVIIPLDERKIVLPWKDVRVQQTETSVVRATQLFFAPTAHKAQAVVETNCAHGRIVIRMQMGCAAICECVTTAARYVVTWNLGYHFGRQGGNDRYETGSVSSQPNRPLINAGKLA